MTTRTYSILRSKEDAKISEIILHGRTIDLGGHKSSSYFMLLKAENPVEVANFDGLQPGIHKQSSGADHTFDLEKRFPLHDSMYDNVLCMNVLEHIYDYNNLLSEAYRILKNGGHMYISVPFFFNIHSSPHDYFRYTRSALERMFIDHGFKDISVIELGDGPCSAIFQNFGGSIPTMFLKLCMKQFSIWVDQVFSSVSVRYQQIRKRVPLGYFVIAHKL